MLYIYSKITAMETTDPGRSLGRARKAGKEGSKWILHTSGGSVMWSNRIERVEIIRRGLPYESIEAIGQKANLPIRQILQYLGVPQTTYNKKKREKDLLSGRDSELVLVLSEVLDFGVEVFNMEEAKFHRWLKKPNMSLGGVTPESLFDSLSGIQEVQNALNRMEYGNMA